MGWRARLAAALLLGLFGGASGTAAHLGGSAYIFVAQDSILPGHQFDLIGADMGAGAAINLRIVHEQLGQARTATDGHFTATLSLPPGFPLGYAQVIATASDGTETSTWVLVGPRTGSTSPPPGSGTWWTDPSVLVLIVFVIGGVGVVGYLLFRPKPRPPVREPGTASATRTVPRKRRSAPSRPTN